MSNEQSETPLGFDEVDLHTYARQVEKERDAANARVQELKVYLADANKGARINSHINQSLVKTNNQLRAELALAVKCVEDLKQSTFEEHGKYGGPLVRVAAFYEDGTEESKYHGINTAATNDLAAYDQHKASK